MSKQPLISVIISCYNYGEYVEQAINSVFAQTYKYFELNVINDGSTDSSDSVIKKILKKAPKDIKVSYITNKKNQGIVSVRNKGLRLARGDFICFLDADDYFNKDYLERSLIVAEKHQADVVYPNWKFFGKGIKELDTDFPEFDDKLLQLQKIHCTAESLIRKSAIKDHKFESEVVAEDWDFFIGLSLGGAKFKLAKDIFINYRLKSGSRATKNDAMNDMRSFVNILARYKNIYGDKVIDPVELPITKFGDYKILEQYYKNLEKEKQWLEQRNKDLEKYAEGLEEQLVAIGKSRSYKVGRVITAPYRVYKKAKH
ncbi:glycosyltransferase [Candidatus Saccharibacteria bacterium]|nr:glycosyltransferase [Candidatus Saccharibacteria bacterium]